MHTDVDEDAAELDMKTSQRLAYQHQQHLTTAFMEQADLLAPPSRNHWATL